MSIPCKMIPLGNSGLPTGYKRLEYIENVVGDNSNSASIRTDIYPTQNTRGRLVAEAVKSSYTLTCYAFGSGSNVNDSTPPFSCLWYHRSYNGGNDATFWMNGKRVGASTYMRVGIHTLEFGKDGFRVDGVLKGTLSNIGEFKSPRKLMFLSETPNRVTARCFRGKAYSFKLWENDMPILDYIPALNPSGVPGMFDTVAKTFKKSATSTPFTAGMTLRQVRDMNLPVPGTVNKLSLSIPCEVYNDSEAWGAIEAAQQKGWTFTFYWTNVVAYLTPQLNAIVGSGNYTISYNYQTSKLNISVNTDVSPVVFMQLQESLAQIVPSGITQTLTWSDGMPADYTRLEYLKSSGTQYIETDLPADRLSFRVVSSHYETASGDGLAVTATSNEKGRFGIYANSIESVAINLRKSSDSNTTWTMFVLPKKEDIFTTTVDFQKMTCTFEGGGKRPYVWSIPAKYETLEGFNTMALFAQHNQSSYTNILKGSIYSFSANYAGTPAANYVPSLNPSGVPGMYDTVSKTFKTNDGTGQFVIGMTLDQVISLKLPAAPAAPDNKLTLSVPGEVMYRQDALKALNAATANGWKLTIQYRDIETPEFQGYVVADYIEKPTGAYTHINTGLSQRLLGYFDYMNTEYNRFILPLWGIDGFYNNSQGSCWVQTSDAQMTLYSAGYFPCPIQEKHQIIHVMGGSKPGTSATRPEGHIGLFIDDTWVLYTNAGQWPNETSNTYKMFTPGSAERLYSARFTDIEHKDIASFIPAIDPDGNPCMFDFVRKQPFYNANGSNKFAFTIGLTKDQAESLVLGDKGSGLTIQVPEGTDLEVMQANNPNVTITIQTIPATTN